MSSETACLGFCSFPPRTPKAGVKNWAEVTWGQMAGTEIAREEIAFGNSVKRFGTLVPYLIPTLGEQAGGPPESVFEDSSSSSSAGRRTRERPRKHGASWEKRGSLDRRLCSSQQEAGPSSTVPLYPALGWASSPPVGLGTFYCTKCDH